MFRSRQRVLKLYGGLVCLVLPLLTFSVILSSEFVMWDDDRAILQNPVTGGLSWERLPVIVTDLRSTSHFTPVTGLFRSLIYECFVVEDNIDAFGYHLGNLLLHATSTWLLFMICCEWIALLAKKSGSKLTRTEHRRQILMAVLAALVWGLHPLRAEPVSWAASGNHCLAVMFLFLSVWLYLKHVQCQGRRFRDPYLWYSLFAYTLSLLSHPIGMVFFVVLIIIDWVPLRRLQRPLAWWRTSADREIMFEKIPFVFVGVLVAIGTIGLQFYDPNYHDPPSPSLDQFGLLERAMQGLYVWVYFSWRVFVPVNLSPTYSTLVMFDPLSLVFVSSAIAFVTITLIVLFLRKRYPMGLVAWSCHLVVIFPVLGLTQLNHVANDRYSLCSSAIWSLLLVSFRFHSLEKKTYRLLVGTVGVTVMVLACLSYRQAKVWHNTEDLFTHILEVLEDDSGREEDIYFRLARSHWSNQRLEKAVEAITKLLELRPDDMAGRTLYASILYQQKKHDQALTEIQIVLDQELLQEDTLHIQSLRGMIYMDQKKWREAEGTFQEVLKVDPKHPIARKKLDELYELKLNQRK